MKLRLPARKIRIYILILTIVVLILVGIALCTQLAVCVSNSLHGINTLFILKGKSFKRGDIIIIEGHETPLSEGKRLAKRVFGIAGDTVFYERKTNTLRVCTPLFPLLTTTNTGEPLNPLSLTTIPEGEVFVVGDHPRSFDSRYEEFGLVKVGQIEGRALWFW